MPPRPPIVIAVDALGGDFGYTVTVSAVCKFLQDFSDVHIVMAGDKSAITASYPYNLSSDVKARLKILAVETPAVVQGEMSRTAVQVAYPAMTAVLNKLAERAVSAVVSAGSSGALVMLSNLMLKRYVGLLKSPLCSLLPTVQQPCYLLDLGAHSKASALHLYQFALLGNAMARIMSGLANPRIALLSNGSEPTKGTAVIQAAAALLQADTSLNYTGFIEGNTLYDGTVDVVVCDGFTGNVLLKTSEGVAKYIQAQFARQSQASVFYKILAGFAWPFLRTVLPKLKPQHSDAALFSGAVLLGVNGLVVKCHGNSTMFDFYQGLKMAYDAACKNMSDEICDQYGKYGR